MHELTQVVFRKFPKREGGDVIAIFYNTPGTNDPYTCDSYMHVGQHASCDPQGLTHALKLATPEEYASLKRELESTPYYYRLDVRKRVPYSAITARRYAIWGTRKHAFVPPTIQGPRTMMHHCGHCSQPASADIHRMGA